MPNQNPYDGLLRHLKPGQSIFDLIAEITPPRLSSPLGSFCRNVGKERPEYVRSEPPWDSERCPMAAVANRVSSRGGSSLCGWKVKCVPGLWATAEYHVVWVSDANVLLDVTRKEDDEEEILFLPDSGRPTSFDILQRPTTLHERLLTDDAEIEITEAFIASFEPKVLAGADGHARSEGFTLVQAVRPHLNFRGTIGRSIDNHLAEAAALARMTVPWKAGPVLRDPTKQAEYDERCASAARTRKAVVDWAKTQLRQHHHQHGAGAPTFRPKSRRTT